MKADYIPKVITLLAGAVVCIVSIVRHMDVTYSLEILLATLIIFYIIGLIAKAILQKVESSNRFIRHKRDEELEREVSLEMEQDEDELSLQGPESEQA
ncbi:MAG: hypothetical protein J1E62_06990 [Lachnospiraceae bacterium]|nr:hypothetical protein [Lachnospiraceae bacterium]